MNLVGNSMFTRKEVGTNGPNVGTFFGQLVKDKKKQDKALQAAHPYSFAQVCSPRKVGLQICIVI